MFALQAEIATEQIADRHRSAERYRRVRELKSAAADQPRWQSWRAIRIRRAPAVTQPQSR